MLKIFNSFALHIEILKPGLFTSLQQKEVTGFRSMGIGPGGVMDEFAASAANHLLRNDEQAYLLEMHFPAPELRFHTGTLIALTGGDFQATCNGEPLNNWQTHFIPGGSTIQFSGLKKGYRAYLSVYGGFKVEEAAMLRFGKTIPLKKGDGLFLNKPCNLLPGTYEAAILPNLYEQVYPNDEWIYCLAGPEWETLSAEAQRQLQSASFTISNQSNRMGYRLEGTPVQHRHEPMLSSAADAGTVQLLPNGLPVILMSAHQTTGGYPRIFSVLSPSRAGLAQLPPGATIRFSIISLQEAAERLISWRQLLAFHEPRN